MVNCVYIHIPFCEKKCKYCAFCSLPVLSYREKYIDTLIKEIKFHYKNETLDTIYFGGGTPSILEINDIKKVLDCLNYNSDTEITLEGNPNSLTLEKLKAYKDFGINRISMGVQNFDDEILNLIGRCHNKKNIYTAIENINKAGYNNYSIDLMYGLPNQDINSLDKTIDEALKIKPPHISIYGLKIEDGTYFNKFLPKNLPTLDAQAKMYELIINKLKNKYIHYEFSNFSTSEKNFSRHNLSYWKRKNYYGFGLSASGFITNKRYTNTFNMKEYLSNPIQRNYETLSKQNEIEEEIFLGLRIYSGINFNYINKKYNINIYSKYKKQFDKFLKNGFLKKTEYGVKLTIQGVLLSNEILCEFIEL